MTDYDEKRVADNMLRFTLDQLDLKTDEKTEEILASYFERQLVMALQYGVRITTLAVIDIINEKIGIEENK